MFLFDDFQSFATVRGDDPAGDEKAFALTRQLRLIPIVATQRSQSASYHKYRFPPDIISHAVWLYHRFCLSFRDAEALFAQRGVTVIYETTRSWCQQFGPVYARRLRCRRGRLGDTWHLDEVFVTIQGRHQYLWRAVDEDGDVLDILVPSHRNRRAAVRFFRTLLKTQGHIPRQLITDLRRFTSAAHVQRFASVHGVIQNLFRVGRHLLRLWHHHVLRRRAFIEWDAATCAC